MERPADEQVTEFNTSRAQLVRKSPTNQAVITQEISSEKLQPLVEKAKPGAPLGVLVGWSSAAIIDDRPKRSPQPSPEPETVEGPEAFEIMCIMGFSALTIMAAVFGVLLRMQ